MPKRTVIGESVKGAFAENDNSYVLIVEDDGSKWIEQEWSFVDPYGKKAPNEGKKRMTVDEFLKGDFPEGLKGKVRRAT
jgi:hypothetical protein